MRAATVHSMIAACEPAIERLTNRAGQPIPEHERVRIRETRDGRPRPEGREPTNRPPVPAGAPRYHHGTRGVTRNDGLPRSDPGDYAMNPKSLKARLENWAWTEPTDPANEPVLTSRAARRIRGKRSQPRKGDGRHPTTWTKCTGAPDKRGTGQGTLRTLRPGPTCAESPTCSCGLKMGSPTRRVSSGTTPSG